MCHRKVVSAEVRALAPRARREVVSKCRRTADRCCRPGLGKAGAQPGHSWPAQWCSLGGQAGAGEASCEVYMVAGGAGGEARTAMDTDQPGEPPSSHLRYHR